VIRMTKKEVKERIQKEFYRELRNLWEKIQEARITSRFDENGKEIILRNKNEWNLVRSCLRKDDWKLPFVKNQVSPRLAAASAVAAQYFLGDLPEVKFSEKGVTVICHGYQCW